MNIKRITTVLLAAILLSGTAATAQTLPTSIDNSKSKYFPPIINQTGGSCAQASYIGYMFTYEINRLLDRDGSEPKNNFSYLYTWNFVNEGIDQGSFGPEGVQLALSNGIMPDYLFPTQIGTWSFKWATGYEKYLEAMKYRAKSIENIPVSSEEGIQNAKKLLAEGDVLTFSGQSTGWKLNYSYSGPSETGYTYMITSFPTDGSHAMTIVGYDDTVEFSAPDGTSTKGAFIMCNSWGEAWASKGRIYYPYWFFLQKRASTVLSNDMTRIRVEVKDPKIVFKVGVECDSRDDLSFKTGVSNKGSDTTPMHNYSVGIANHAGGDHEMLGSHQGKEIEFGFDFSPYEARVNEMEEPQFFLTVSRSKRGSEAATVANLTKFEVYDYRTTPATVYTYEINGKIALKSGDNVFGLPTVAPKKTSFSPVQWLSTTPNPDGKQPAAAPLVFRAADGKYYKVRLSEYDRTNGRIKIRYKQM